MKYFTGIDIGGTNTKIGILNKNGEILNTRSIKTESIKGPENTIRRIWETVKEMAVENSVNIANMEGIGVGIPGPVIDESIVKIAANFSWGNDFPAKKMFEEITEKKVKIANDVKVIALGEQLYGAGKGYKSSITIPIGTGIAAGIIVDGKILSGSTGAGGEFGHIVIKKNGHKCGCGLRGCLETYCSATGIVREGKIILENNKNSILFQVTRGDLNKLDSYYIFSEAKKGDKTAIEIVDHFCDNLAHGIGTLLNIINPEIIIFGGGVSKAGDIIIKGVEKHLYKYALKMTIDNLKFAFGQLQENAGIKGAAALIIQDMDV
ncbi:ROK family protein [Leptotrichia sp. OH3620_COT-345]|uniref:ROK family protein n=1 Tax=Leptotrichia sp. OH3620_COT-345 TaxID=2491048 RepID=UPI000F64B05A|nr:ROK family protein [Leptotrichia sp. OH3620_COT-345]RRD39493.1 ROK family protein [Leptotrichia sp. OH3620_COT-345]